MKKIIFGILSLFMSLNALVASQDESNLTFCQECTPPEKRFTITNFEALPKIRILDTSNNQSIAIRRYESNGISYYLVVDPQTLETRQLPVSQIHSSYGTASTELLTRYEENLIIESDPTDIGNQGVKCSNNRLKGVFLTIDMCQSRKEFEKLLFQRLSERESPISVGIAMTGLWAERNLPGIFNHAQEFSYLRSLNRHGKLKITWINHSYNHPYDPEQNDFSKNFLSTPGINFQEEVLSVERMLLSYGEAPSVFFRFPGLVSSSDQINTLNELGLIPLGSNAWLEKGEIPVDGSIILIHGNSNEPGGVEKFLKLLEENSEMKFNSLLDLFK